MYDVSPYMDHTRTSTTTGVPLMKNNSVQKVYLDGMFAGVFTKSGLHIWGGPFFKIDISGHGTASVYETELPASSLQPPSSKLQLPILKTVLALSIAQCTVKVIKPMANPEIVLFAEWIWWKKQKIQIPLQRNIPAQCIPK